MPTPSSPRAEVLSAEVDLADGDALGDWLGELRRKLRDSGRGKVRITVSFEEDG